VSVPSFACQSACTACPLHETPGLENPGMPSRVSDFGVSGRPKALLVVGDGPNRSDDRAGQVFSGQLGAVLHRLYLGVDRLQDLADIYLGNATRCRSLSNSPPTQGQVRRCQPHLLGDIRELQAHYSEVVILCVGAPATQAILNSSLSEAFSRQGDFQNWGWAGTEGLAPVRVFATYHPSNILSGRNPSRVVVIQDHIRMLSEYLQGGGTRYDEQPPVQVCPEVPPYRFKRLALDVESYGAVASEPPQTCFHPVKSLHFDKPAHLLHTAAVSWRGPDGALQTAAFILTRREHRIQLCRFIRNLEAGGDLLGQNIKFDLLYLRAFHPVFRALFSPYSIRITELSVLNYLHSEQRPERSLKAIAPLLNITKYEQESSLKHFRYPRSDDPELLAYNCKDAWATYLAVEKLEALLLKDFPESPKNSEYSRTWYSRLIWTCLQMEESGVAFSLSQLDALDYSLVLKSALLYSECSARWNITLGGKGSGKSIKDLYEGAVEEAQLLGDSRIELTKKKKEISCNKKNASILLETLPPGTIRREQLKLQQAYEEAQKLVTTYTRTMLHGSEGNPVGSRLVPVGGDVGIAYPSWFPVPSHFDSGAEGGTIQSRITCKGPALQTLPYIVKNCITTRFNPGFFIWVDLSQIELRVAALMSGDPLMMREYHEGVDRHTQTALFLIEEILKAYPDRSFFHVGKLGYPREELEGYFSKTPAQLKKDPRFKDVWRQIGKTSNFLILFRGGGGKLRMTIADDLGVDLPLAVCEAFVARLRARYAHFNAWQDSLVETAARTGRIELPLIGQSRTFIGTKKVLEDTYLAEICNIGIQAPAACVMQDIQATLYEAFALRYTKVHVAPNIFDAVGIDGPLSEYRAALSIVHACFGHSAYWDDLSRELARSVPLGYDVSVFKVDKLDLKAQPSLSSPVLSVPLKTPNEPTEKHRDSAMGEVLAVGC